MYGLKFIQVYWIYNMFVNFLIAPVQTVNIFPYKIKIYASLK